MNNMKCKNCGADISDNAKVCKNCGAFIDDENGYVLLTSDDMMPDVYADESYEPEQKQKKGGAGRIFIRAVSLILTLAIIGAGAFYYFTKIYKPFSETPPLSFKTGSGIINDDEKIIYVLLDEKSNIEYIHGVSLYDYDKTDKNAEKKGSVSTDYEYTKSIDSTFRAIFFDVDKLNIPSGENTYTFEMKFSFNNSEEIFTYYQPITFSSEISDNAADLVFDHSQSEEATTSPVEAEPETEKETTTQSEKTTDLGDISFIYNFYWFTEPVQNEDEMSISAIKLNEDNSYVSTSYYKNGDKSWEISTYNGNYKIENGYIVLNNGEATESTYYKIDASESSLYEEENSAKTANLTPRKYNSLKNVEDFFGI